MRIRGKIFWSWADPTFPHLSHDETFSDGTYIDVQARLSRTGGTQLFFGVYAQSGQMLDEQMFDAMPGESVSRALAWGVGRARQTAREYAGVGESSYGFQSGGGGVH